MTQPLVQAVQAVPSQPATVRIGTVVELDPLSVSVQGTVFVGVGKMASYFMPALGDVVALVGQSALTADAASWLVLGRVDAGSGDVQEFVPPQAKAWNSTLVTFTTGVGLVVPLQTELWDTTGDMHSGTLDPSRIYAPIDGRYLILANLGYASSGVNRRICQVRANAAGNPVGGVAVTEEVIQATLPGSTVVGCKAEYDLLAGEYVEMFGTQNSGGNLDSAAVVHQSWMSIRWMSQISGTP